MKHEDTGNSYIDSLLSSKELNWMLFENAADAIFFVEKLKIVDCDQAAWFRVDVVQRICGETWRQDMG